MVNNRWLLTILLLALLPASAAWANTLKAVSFSTFSGGRVEVVLKTSGPVGEVRSFSTDHPARIAIDLPDTHSGLDYRTKKISLGAARSVTAVEAGNRTRVVVNLADKVPYRLISKGNEVHVMIDAGTTTEPGQTAITVASRDTRMKMRHGAPQIEKVDFRRGGKGVARVEVKLSNPDVSVDMRRQGRSVVLDFLGVQVPPDQARVLDVTDFVTPVQTITTMPHRGGARMVIKTKGEFDHLAYQADNLYVVEFREMSKREKEKRKRKELVYTGDKLSLNFQNIPVRAVLQLLADFTGINMVVSDSVTGNITLRLQNVPWDQALDIILKSKGLAKRRNGKVIMVAPAEEIAAREKLELEATKQVEELAPLHSELIQINYAKAQDLANLLKSKDNRLLSDRGNVTVDARTNSLLVQDTAAKLDEVRALVEKLDIPVRQVLVESRVVIANDDFARDLGVRFGFNKAHRSSSGQWLISGGRPVVSASATGSVGTANGLTDPSGAAGIDALMVNLPKTLAPGRGGAFNVLVGTVGSYLLQLELSAMQQEGRGEVISNPRVVTSDQSTAVIKQGIQIPYQQTSANGATTVQFKDAVLKLEVTPHITPDDRIIMDLLVSKDRPDFTQSVLGVPPLETRQVKTRVLVNNGETVVLGGVFERDRSKKQEKVPFFGDLPGVGWAFKQQYKQDKKKELLIFVTPKIIKDSLSVR